MDSYKNFPVVKFIVTAVIAVVAIAVFGTEAFAKTEFEFSGMVRIRPEMKDNSDFNDAKDDETAFVGSRTRINVKAKVKEDVFGKVVIQDVRRWGEANQVSTSKEKQSLDVYEAYFQINKIKGTPLSVKIGRQMLAYGDQRLLGSLGWVDQARTHDAAKVMLDFGISKVDIFAAKEAESGKPTADDADDDLIGIYSMTKVAKGIDLDVYAINWKTANSKTVTNTDAAGNTTTSDVAVKGKNIMTYGARLAVKFGGFDATGEYVLQDGDWADGISQSADALAVKAGYTFDYWKTRIGLEYDHGSGDSDPNDNKNENFVFPFHTNHAHYGYMDFFSWGNMNDFRISLKTKPAKQWVVKLDYHILSLDSGTADWLNVVGTKPFKKAVAGKDSTDAGTEIDATVVYKAMSNMKVVGGYSIFEPGDAAKERSGGHDDQAQWGYVMAVFSF